MTFSLATQLIYLGAPAAYLGAPAVHLGAQPVDPSGGRPLDADAYIAERLPLINAGLEARFERGAMPDALRGAMRHLLFPGGKRLRPVFSMAAAEAVGGSAASALPIALAVELIHTYSLVHDDLPCMDDDDERRGQPTVHIAFDEATAVLAGDALLTEAFGAIADGVSSAGSSSAAPTPENAVAALQAISRLADAAGAQGLVGGQVDDLDFEAQAELEGADSSASGTEQARLASIHARKTAALFQASIVGGAMLGGASEQEQASLDAFGREVGIAFQIADDVLDADSDEAASILRLQGEGAARQGAEELLEQALERIEGWGERAEPLRALARFAVRRKR